MHNVSSIPMLHRDDATVLPPIPLPEARHRVTDSFHSGRSHALFWMMIANATGLLLATLLLFPTLNHWLGPYAYGRWMPVHLNLHLYGWTSLPLVLWLIRMYRVTPSPLASWSASAWWVWSTAMAGGMVTWLLGQSSGKVFLDWIGFARYLFPAAMSWLWLLLALAWAYHARRDFRTSGRRLRTGLEGVGLLVLVTVPAIWFWSAGQDVYPAVNRESGGPTGVSLLGSTLVVLLAVLLLPSSLGKRTTRLSWAVPVSWGYFLAQVFLFLMLDKSHSSHRRWDQLLGLGSLVVWWGLLPCYYRAYDWPPATRHWRAAFVGWLLLLILTGWMSFWPGILDRLKFTDGLVAHSHLAMAGFVTSFNMFLLTMLGSESNNTGSLERRVPFWAWTAATLAYVLLMWIAGWIEGTHPQFTIQSTPGRNAIYAARWLCGAVMLGCSVAWLWGAIRSTKHLQVPNASAAINRPESGITATWRPETAA